jgi:hypothetical protein
MWWTEGGIEIDVPVAWVKVRRTRQVFEQDHGQSQGEEAADGTIHD